MITNTLNKNLLLVKERVDLLKAAHNYDILDPATGLVIMECRENNLRPLTRLLRFSDCKRITPFDLRVTALDGAEILRVVRGIPVYVSRVKVLDAEEHLIGGFKQKLFSVSGAFDVIDAADKPVCRIEGRLAGWDFRFLTLDGVQLARVSKQWAGLGKELLTNADDYMLEIDEAVPQDSTIRQLIFASVLCIDMVLRN
jgi:uncharacterized protein YxjI